MKVVKGAAECVVMKKYDVQMSHEEFYSQAYDEYSQHGYDEFYSYHGYNSYY